MPAEVPTGRSGGPQRPFTVVLTGGIASGKTAVSDRLGELGATVVDTDVIAREVVAPGQPALAEIVRHFGAAVLGPDGALDRPALRARVFADPAERQALERITHPRIRALAQARTAAADGPYAVIVVPLLVESGSAYPADRVLVVDCARDTQLERLTARDGVTRAAAEAVLNSQASREARLAIADDVLTNESTLAALLDAADVLHGRYQRMAAEAAG